MSNDGKLQSIEIAISGMMASYYSDYNGTYAPAASVIYMEWDDANKKLVETSTTEYTEVTNSTTTLEAGKFYVVKDNNVQTGTLTVNGTSSEPTTLILMDGAKLTVIGSDDKAGVGVAQTNALVITGQKEGTGTLIAEPGVNGAAIGGGKNGACGTVTINGGVVETTTEDGGAGIGGGNGGNGGTVTINGGTVTANGSDDAAGIGGGKNGACGTVTINGGTVTAIGGCSGAGIGGGEDKAGGSVTINGGTVTALSGGYGSAAIGRGGGANLDGTLTFGEGVDFKVMAGANSGSATEKSTTEYATDHSAAYVKIEKNTDPV